MYAALLKKIISYANLITNAFIFIVNYPKKYLVLSEAVYHISSTVNEE